MVDRLKRALSNKFPTYIFALSGSHNRDVFLCWLQSCSHRLKRRRMKNAPQLIENKLCRNWVHERAAVAGRRCRILLMARPRVEYYAERFQAKNRASEFYACRRTGHGKHGNMLKPPSKALRDLSAGWNTAAAQSAAGGLRACRVVAFRWCRSDQWWCGELRCPTLTAPALGIWRHRTGMGSVSRSRGAIYPDLEAIDQNSA